MLTFVCIWTMWDLNKARYANFQSTFFVVKSVMLTFKSGLMDLTFTGSLLPRLWLFGTREACLALDANSVALGFRRA